MFELIQTEISVLHEKIETLKIHFIDRTYQLDKETVNIRELIDHVQTGVENRIEAVEADIKDLQYIADKLQNFFSGKVKNPIYEAIEAHIEEFNKRLGILDNKIIDTNDLDERVDGLENIQAEPRLIKLEEMMADRLDPTAFVILKEKITVLETEINTVRALGSCAYHPKRPHKCPVCEGSQRDYFDMLLVCSQYPDNTKLDQEGRRYQECRACEGKGILWG